METQLVYKSVVEKATAVPKQIEQLLIRGRTTPNAMRIAINANFNHLPDGLWKITAKSGPVDHCFFLLAKHGEHGCYFQQRQHSWDNRIMLTPVEKFITFNDDQDPSWAKAFSDIGQNVKGNFAALVNLVVSAAVAG